jgi:hypothetical protein
MKNADTYSRKGLLIIETSSETTDGVHIWDGKPMVLSTESTEETIGRALLATLSQSRTGVPHPTEWKGAGRELYEAVGVRRWSEFVAGCKSCSVTMSPSRIRFEPSRYREDYRGFAPMPEAEFSIPAKADPGQIGAALLRGLELSRGMESENREGKPLRISAPWTRKGKGRTSPKR